MSDLNKRVVCCLVASALLLLTPLSAMGRAALGKKGCLMSGDPEFITWEDAVSIDGSANESSNILDNTPLEWSAVDAHTTKSGDADIVYHGSTSLKIAVLTGAETDDGAINTLAAGNLDFSTTDYIAMWMYCDTTTTAGDWHVYLNDTVGGEERVDIPAIDTPNTWIQFPEIDISGIAAGDRGDIDDFGLYLSAAGAAAMPGHSCYFDLIAVYGNYVDTGVNFDQSSEVFTLGIQTGQGQPNTMEPFEEGVDHLFLYYDPGNEFYVPLKNLSGYSVWGLQIAPE